MEKQDLLWRAVVPAVAVAAVGLLSVLLVSCERRKEISQENPDPTALVKIKVRPSGSDFELLVGPRGVGICRTAKADCLTEVTFRWIGSDHGYDQLTIQTTGPYAQCLDPQTVTLTSTGRSGEKSATVASREGCEGKLYVFYSVTAEDRDGSGVTLSRDPGVIIEG